MTHRNRITKHRYFSERQIIGILNEHEADVSVSDLPQAWRQRRQQLQTKSDVRRDGVSEAKRPKTLEDENTRLKLLLADA